MKRENKILIGIFIIALLIRMVFVFSSPVKIWDETVYSNLGYDLSKNFLEYSLRGSGWSDFIPSGGDSNYSWPKMGARAPLLPYLISIFYLFHLDFLINFLMALFGAISVILVYSLGKKLFDKKVGTISALFFALVPLHVVSSAKIFTGTLFTFFVLLTFLSFWKGYEEDNKKHKILFGVFLALALLSRYTALWLAPIFLFYFLIRDKSLKFLKDRYLWYAILAFFLILVPWFFYGFFEYGNIFGGFIHGSKAASYWGGTQSWHFFFDYWWSMFSALGIIFIFALVSIFYKKDYFKKEIYFILLGVIVLMGFSIYMPHKEGRYILFVVPGISILTGYFVNSFIKYKKIFIVGIVVIMILSLGLQFNSSIKNSYTDSNKCFLESMNFLKNVDAESVVVTDESPVVYYYTKIETRWYPYSWDLEVVEDMHLGYPGREIYILFGESVSKTGVTNEQMKSDLEGNFEKVFSCEKGSVFSSIYRIN